MAPTRVDNKIYSRGVTAKAAQRVYAYTGQWPHEIVEGFKPAFWSEKLTCEFATLIGLSHDAKNVKVKDVVQQLSRSVKGRTTQPNHLTRFDISQVRKWLRDEKGVTATRSKRVSARQEESGDESEKGSESEAESESEGDSGSDPEPLPEINVCNSDDSTSDSSSDDDEMEIDEPIASTTTNRPSTRQRTGGPPNKHLPTSSLTAEAARKRLFDGLNEHYRRSIRRAAMAKHQSQPKPRLLLTPPASGGSVPPDKKCDETVSSNTPLSQPPASSDEAWPKRLRTRAGNIPEPSRPGQLESPFRRESAASIVTIPDSTAESEETSWATAPASPASVSSNCDEHEQSRASLPTPATAPATAAPPSINPFAVAPATTQDTPSNNGPSSTIIDPTSTGRPRRNIQLPSRISHSQPQSTMANVETSRKRSRADTCETNKDSIQPMSLESAPDTGESSPSAMGSLTGNSPASPISTQAVSLQTTAVPPDLSLRREKSTTSHVPVSSSLQVPVESAGSESSSTATLRRNSESSIPQQSNSPPTSASPPAKRQKIVDTRATSASSDDSHATQPTEDPPDYDSLIADWDAKAARVANVHMNVQENRKTLSAQSKYVEFLEHMHKTHPPDEDGRKHYEDERKKLGDIQFIHGVFLRGFEEAKRAAVADADPDVTIAEQARRMGACKRREE
ncbi:hypothetical protein NW768_002585 [Fusarium equiseti]|uniref:Uncharacterized protein n=1 Tax=Fusarium equiseti TaxID=61235 RepID=A0ABQ8RPE5_FUSEQ|nr:hypothetical protein NW768_002585 [Fusarium equiseti]